jgi:CTP synthase
MLKVLMIDDEADVITVVRDYLTETIADIDFCEEVDFEQGVNTLRSIRPDVLILDWFDGPAGTGSPAGQTLWEVVWNEWFCPLVIYTAGAIELADLGAENHPFIRKVAKGAGTQQLVAQGLQGFAPHVAALHQVIDDFSRVVQVVLKSLAVPLFTAETNDDKRREILVRAARRRAAAMIDDATSFGGEFSHAWEQYIFPVLTTHPITGDVLRDSTGDAADPASFRVVLTPTCDMVVRNDKCKVDSILAAKCEPPLKFITDGIIPQPKNKADLKKRLKSALNEAHQAGIAILPDCPGAVPLASVNLRALELIPVSQIGADKKFVRVASIDSPFREQMMWAYTQVGCRPGLPPRDTKLLVNSLADLWTPPTS